MEHMLRSREFAASQRGQVLRAVASHGQLVEGLSSGHTVACFLPNLVLRRSSSLLRPATSIKADGTVGINEPLTIALCEGNETNECFTCNLGKRRVHPYTAMSLLASFICRSRRPVGSRSSSARSLGSTCEQQWSRTERIRSAGQ
jgi:hypothetical protein